MKQYTLKPGQAPFEMVDGPLAGKRYERGKVYSEIPTELAGRFATVPEPPKAKAPSAAAKAKETVTDADPTSNP